MNTSTSYLAKKISRAHFHAALVKNRIRVQLPWPVDTQLQAPIFIIGSSRSGTTLLAELIDAHPDLCHFTEHPITRRHMWQMVKHPNTQPEELPALERSLKRFSGIKNGQRLIEKTPGNSLISKPLAEYFADARIIHIVRDARDVASSMLGHEWIADELQGIHETFWLPFLPSAFQKKWSQLDLWEKAVLRWAVYVSKAREASIYSDRYLEVSYEDICGEPLHSLSKIFNFLDIGKLPSLKEKAATVNASSAHRWKKKQLSDRHIAFHQKVVESFGISI